MATINSIIRVSGNVYNIVGTGAPVAGTNGTLVNIAGPGSTYNDDATGSQYTQTNVITSPSWSRVVNSTNGLFAVRGTYDFAVDGGAISTITPVLGFTLPIYSVVYGGLINVITPGTTGASGTMAIGTSAGSSSASIKAALAAASYTGILATIPICTAASAFKMTAAGNLQVVIATGTFTAGKWDIMLEYFLGTA